VNIFNTGQGNGVILTHGEKLLVLDFGFNLYAGVKSSWIDKDSKKLTPGKMGKINTVIGDGILEAKMVTSHNDSDHNNLIGGPVRDEQLDDPVRSLSGDALGAVGKQLFTKVNKNRGRNGLLNLPNLQRLEGGFGTKQQAQDFLTGSLGNDVTVEAIRPSEYRNDGDNNNRNLIIRVTYGGRNLMFLGDAPSSLLSDIKETSKAFGVNKNNKNKKADFVLASHHGSEVHGEREVLYGVAELSEKAPVVVISSDAREVNGLPKSSTINNHLLKWYDNSHKDKKNKSKWDHTVREHGIRVSDNNMIRTIKTKRPIFDTSSAIADYYSLVINSEAGGDGEDSMKMYDGDSTISGADNLLAP
jgi:hypothetical protein